MSNGAKSLLEKRAGKPARFSAPLSLLRAVRVVGLENTGATRPSAAARALVAVAVAGGVAGGDGDVVNGQDTRR